MEREWLEVAYINFDKVIMYGQVQIEVRSGDFYMRQDTTIEQVLTPEQKTLLEDLNYRHEREMRALLKGFL